MGDLNLERAAATARLWHKYVNQAEEYQLRLRMEDVLNDLDTVKRALTILCDETPLKDKWPDGTRASPPYTPRQVLMLSETDFVVITHEMKAYQEAYVKVRKELGRHEPRRCEGATKAGMPCRGHALPYSSNPFCHNHSGEYERAHNKSMHDKEEKMLKAELEHLGLVAASTGEVPK